jgi:intein/homing endonuclease
MSTGEFQSIDSINIGDIVTDAHGDARQVINVLEYDIEEELVELTFEDGRIIKCTKDHKFLTNNRGYVSADELTDEDDVVDLKSC